MVKLLFKVVLLYSTIVLAKEPFTLSKIPQYVNKNNPFYITVMSKYYITEGKRTIAEGAFDTNIGATYEEKVYPLSESTYENVLLHKPLYNGIELSMGYRKAQGTQEYNNIKTGMEGEMIASVTLPLMSIIHDTSASEVSRRLTVLESKAVEAQSKGELLHLYFLVVRSYYEVLYRQEIARLYASLHQKAVQRFSFVQKEVLLGNRPKIALYEVENQKLSRKQKLLEIQNKFEKSKNELLKYLALSPEVFEKYYTLPRLVHPSLRMKSLSYYLNKAKKQRFEFEALDHKEAQIREKKRFNALGAYPSVDIKLSGVRDMYYEESGYKVSAGFKMPLERRHYKGQEEVLKRELMELHGLREKLTYEIKTNIRNILQTISMRQNNLKLIKKELKLSKKLESAEKQKYYEGTGTLVLVNQREVTTLNIETKLFQVYFDLHVLKMMLLYETGSQILL